MHIPKKLGFIFLRNICLKWCNFDKVHSKFEFLSPPSQCAVAFFNVNQKTQEVCWYFWVNIFYTNQNLSKKPSVNRAAKILQPKNHFLSDLLKNPKGGPFYVKKFFISDFDETQNLIYLGPKNSTHEIWAKLEIKIFLT